MWVKSDNISPDFQGVWIKNLVKSKYHLLNFTAACWLSNTEFIGNKVQDLLVSTWATSCWSFNLPGKRWVQHIFFFFHLNFCLHQKSFHDCNEALYSPERFRHDEKQYQKFFIFDSLLLSAFKKISRNAASSACCTFSAHTLSNLLMSRDEQEITSVSKDACVCLLNWISWSKGLWLGRWIFLHDEPIFYCQLIQALWLTSFTIPLDIFPLWQFK